MNRLNSYFDTLQNYNFKLLNVFFFVPEIYHEIEFII